MIAATIALCALGHAIRDGFMPTGSTHAARALGGFLCVLGGFLATWDWTGALMGMALYAGFYTDQLHGEGARARGWGDAGFLAISGVTSLVPLLGALAYIHAGQGDYLLWCMAVPLAGLAKPAIWFLAWRTVPLSWQPTRIAAVGWGALTGGLVATLAI